jgi:hypothetical protein
VVDDVFRLANATGTVDQGFWHDDEMNYTAIEKGGERIFTNFETGMSRTLVP